MEESPLLELWAGKADVEEYRGCRLRVGQETEPPAWPPDQVLLYDAGWRAVLTVEGPEARKWLNGMITANVRDLAPGRWAPSFQLDPKGHILAELSVACTGADAFLLLSDETQRAGLLERLRRFVFISKLTITDASAAWSAVQWRGPGAGAAAVAAGVAAAELQPGEVAASPAGGWWLAGEAGGIELGEWLAPAEAIRAAWPRLLPQARPAGSAAQERDRILSRVPRYGADITAAELPQETGQLDHLDYTKGCYIGQEIVERIRARGAVHRHWAAFQFPEAVAAGSEVQAEGKAVGKVTSVTQRGGGWLGLGYIRDPHHQPGQTVAAGAVTGTVED
ncbi:MAG: CAF17-like 4Fe-4S cluster assembly/insertion protein YgfZ [Terriglobales bacterium]